MAITVQIYSNANSSSRTITFDFVGNILASSNSNAACSSFYFNVSASGTQDNGSAFPVKIIKGLDGLVLNGQMQSSLNSYSTSPYTDIKSMVVDYVYDYVNGHTANEGGSGCTLQRPMKFK